MAGTLDWREHRNTVKRSVRDAYAHHTKVVAEQQEAAQEAQAQCPDKLREPLDRLCDAAERVADSASSAFKLLERIELLYGDKLEELQRDKERVDFAARHRDFICLFEDGVFQRMKTLEKYKEALKAGADRLKNASEALELLASMARADKSQDEDVRAVLTDENKLVREAWSQAVVAKGLQLEEYAALRDFKGDTNRSFHQSESPEQVPVELNKPLSLPEKYAPYKEPVMKLLELLARPAAGARELSPPPRPLPT